MKKLLFLYILLISLVCFSQETLNYPKYTLSQIYKMIENEKSDTFTLKNANIVLDSVADKNLLLQKLSFETRIPVRKDSIEIHKAIIFENVFSKAVQADDNFAIAFNKVIFHKPVTIKNCQIWLTHNHFKAAVNIRYNDDILKSFKDNFDAEDSSALIYLEKNRFEFDPRIISRRANNKEYNTALWLQDCILKGTDGTRDIPWFLSGFRYLTITNNTFLSDHPNYIAIGNTRGRINNNNFGDRLVQVFFTDDGVKPFEFRENKISKPFFLRLPESIENLQMDWNQFSLGVLSMTKYAEFVQALGNVNSTEDYDLAFQNEDNILRYSDSVRVVNRLVYKSEIGLIGTLNSIYKRQHDLESANASYITLKDLETKRLQYLYDEQPSFDTYFEWKVNQFLKLFSDYGTRPAKAIVVSVYVILFFAMIYLLFPNSWDKHGKNRIMDRYRFFTKYMNRDAGIHEVYLEEQKEELLESEEFKNYMLSAEKTIPSFFLKTAMPLYKWSVSGMKFSASLLKRVDVMKGTWQNLPEKRRTWKTILLVGAFTIALLYDITIKILNALMLSINTFTTLGFGEIPIKGLPRYLAIIQGFIGWFMLTIFSVSLISQLLN